MRRWFRRISLALLAVFVLVQLYPSGRTNPPVTGDLDAPADVESVLRRCCYDCHSNESRWPWYAHVAPVSWLLVKDVDAGRKKLNFSKWSEYPAEKRAAKADQMIEEIEERGMPLPSYRWMHADAVVQPAEIEMLKRWVGTLDQ